MTIPVHFYVRNPMFREETTSNSESNPEKLTCSFLFKGNVQNFTTKEFDSFCLFEKANFQDTNYRSGASSLRCPLSHHITILPVKTRCNHTFEYFNIVQRLATNNRCPTCNEQIKREDLVFNAERINSIWRSMDYILWKGQTPPPRHHRSRRMD